MLSLVVFYFAFGGSLFLFESFVYTHRLIEAHLFSGPLATEVAAGTLIALAWLRAAILLWRRLKRGAVWGLASLFAVAAQWAGWAKPTIGEALTVVAVGIVLLLSWHQELQDP